MFCPKCGTRLADGVKFCNACGAPIDQANTAENVTPSPIDSTNPAAPMPKARNYRLYGILAVILVVVIILGIIFGVANGNGAEKVAKKYATAMLKADLEEADKYYAIHIDDFLNSIYESDYGDFFSSAMKDKYDTTDPKKLIDLIQNDFHEEVEDQYGEKYKVTVTVKSADTLSNSKMKEIVKSFQKVANSFDIETEDLINVNKIKTIVKVKLSLQVKGDDDEETNSEIVYVANVGSKWLVFGSDGDLSDPITTVCSSMY